MNKIEKENQNIDAIRTCFGLFSNPYMRKTGKGTMRGLCVTRYDIKIKKKREEERLDCSRFSRTRRMITMNDDDSTRTTTKVSRTLTRRCISTTEKSSTSWFAAREKSGRLCSKQGVLGCFWL